MKNKKIILHSGGADSLALMLIAIEEYGHENIISLGFNYGQKNFSMENEAACKFCNDFNIERILIDLPLGTLGDFPLINNNISITSSIDEQRTTVIPLRNGIFIMMAASLAQTRNADTIIIGACKEDYKNYRDCRQSFYDYMEYAIQSGISETIKGSDDIILDIKDGIIDREKIDIKIKTPLINFTKKDIMKLIVSKHPISIYKYSYTCYKGERESCGECTACQERLKMFRDNAEEDPIQYRKNKK